MESDNRYDQEKQNKEEVRGRAENSSELDYPKRPKKHHQHHDDGDARKHCLVYLSSRHTFPNL
jgi:hypothetical protein